MKLCAFLILATATSVIADGHADICSSQFNWWYGVANNQGPLGSNRPVESAEEKLHRLVKKARPGMPVPSMCEMQKNANRYYHHWEKILREINNMTADAYAPGFGFPFQSKTGPKSYNGLTPTCVKEDSIAGRFITSDDVQNNAGGPAASCAFGYPGLGGIKTTLTAETPDGSTNVTLLAKDFKNVTSTCRLKILGFEDEDLELQWCITNILETMRVDKAGGYYDGYGSTTPDLNCTIQNSFNDANPIAGNGINPPYKGSPYPTTFLGTTTPLGPNPGGDPVQWKCFTNVFKNITTVQDCFDKFEKDKNITAFEECSLQKAGLYPKNDPNDPYQSFPILFRQLADQKVAGMCSACEECRIAVRNDGVYPDPEEYCQRAGKCEGTPPPLPPMPPKKKSSKKK